MDWLQAVVGDAFLFAVAMTVVLVVLLLVAFADRLGMLLADPVLRHLNQEDEDRDGLE